MLKSPIWSNTSLSTTLGWQKAKFCSGKDSGNSREVSIIHALLCTRNKSNLGVSPLQPHPTRWKVQPQGIPRQEFHPVPTHASLCKPFPNRALIGVP